MTTLTVPDAATRAARMGALVARKGGVPLVMLTAYDFPSARAAATARVDVILVGDSAAMTVLGYANTRDISIDEMLMLARAVRRGAPDTAIVGDMPYGSYEASNDDALATARRFVHEAGCDAVKLEGAGAMAERVEAIVADGIAVVGHVGLLPQGVTDAEDYRARGRNAADAHRIVRDSEQLAHAGASLIVVEAVASPVGRALTARVRVPIIGIGAGLETDGQVLVYHDLIGYGEGRHPRFVRQYTSVFSDVVHAIEQWSADVRSRAYPALAEQYGMPPEELRAFLEQPPFMADPM